VRKCKQKKLKNGLNRENWKKIIKKPNREKKSIKPITILKKLTGSVRFGFISLKPKKLNRTQTEKN
jgi:hypothetical protein